MCACVCMNDKYTFTSFLRKLFNNGYCSNFAYLSCSYCSASYKFYPHAWKHTHTLTHIHSKACKLVAGFFYIKSLFVNNRLGDFSSPSSLLLASVVNCLGHLPAHNFVFILRDFVYFFFASKRNLLDFFIPFIFQLFLLWLSCSCSPAAANAAFHFANNKCF